MVSRNHEELPLGKRDGQGARHQIRKAGFQDKGATVSLLKKENKELKTKLPRKLRNENK